MNRGSNFSKELKLEMITRYLNRENAFDKQDYVLLNDCLDLAPKGISSYMNKSLRTLKQYKIYVINTFSTPSQMVR